MKNLSALNRRNVMQSGDEWKGAQKLDKIAYSLFLNEKNKLRTEKSRMIDAVRESKGQSWSHSFDH